MPILKLLYLAILFRMLIFKQFFEKNYKVEKKTLPKNAIKVVAFLILFLPVAKYVFSRFESIIFYLALNTEELFTLERIDTLKNLGIISSNCTPDFPQSEVMFVSFILFVWLAILLLPREFIFHGLCPPIISGTTTDIKQSSIPKLKKMCFEKTKIFLHLCHLRN